MSDEYRTVTATVTRIGHSSITVSTPNGLKVIPRSLLHGADDRYIETTLPRGEIEPFEWTFRLLDWKAEQLGLAG